MLDSNAISSFDQGMTKETPSLQSAYALETPDDNRKLYADWAADYDQDFARQQDYHLPVHTAEIFVKAGGTGPVLDVGAGTGLCGAILANLGVGPIDAVDISAEMLDVAMAKDIYRDAIEADLNEGIPVPRDSYNGIISSGTFTTGHVGPEALDALLRVARPGALFAISINARHYEAAGFAAKLSALQDGQIRNLTLPETRIYGDNATGEHKDDIALIALFEKT